MAEEIHKNDIGTVFRATIKETGVVLDISNATTKEFYFFKPSCTVVTQTAGFLTDGTNGIMQYITTTGDLDEVGTWKIQGHIVTASGNWRTDIKKFEVYENLS